MDRGPLLSLCMIVKDGGASLRRCLESARDVADETIVVDTGSSDDSVAIARAAGARVLDHAWSDDFAAARNVSLEAARGEWILVLDADEELEPARPRFVREALSREQYVGYYLSVVSELADGERLDASILRLFRRSPRVRFRFPIHEQVLPDLQALADETGRRFALLTDVSVRHGGYTASAMARHGKIERNLRLFAKALALNPDEPYLWYKYADFLRSVPERRDEGARVAERALELLRARGPGTVDSTPYYSEVLTLVAASRLETSRRDDALALLDEEPPARHGSPHYHYVAALVLEAAGRLDAALECARACAGASRPLKLSAWRPSIVGVRGNALRARIHLRKGEARLAEDSARRALESQAGFLPAVQLLADAVAMQGRVGEALELLTSRLRDSPHAPSSPFLWRQIAALLRRIGREEEARRCLALAEPPEAMKTPETVAPAVAE